MLIRSFAVLVGCAIGLGVGAVGAQPPVIPPPKATPVVNPPPGKDVEAARVNGQALPELAVYRGLLHAPEDQREQMRKEVVNFLIDNMIVDQYLLQLKIQIDEKEVTAHFEKLKAEAKKENKDFAAILRQLFITENELRSELMPALRWDKFVAQQGTDAALKDMFAKNIDMFNGSQMRTRHVLIAVENGNKDAALARIAAIKKEIDLEVAQAVAKLPPSADAITREKERARALDQAFAEAASRHSTCPSKKAGGDLGYFPRVGKMVEPFARAAFTLKPFQMSEPVATEFGYHLILAVDLKPGNNNVTFDQVKRFVQEVYAERLREAILNHYKAKSKIEIFERKK